MKKKKLSFAYRKQTDKEKTQWTRLALGIAGVTCNTDVTPEIIWRTFEAMQRLGGKFSVRDGARIKAQVEERNKRINNALSKKHRTELLKYLRGGLKNES